MNLRRVVLVMITFLVPLEQVMAGPSNAKPGPKIGVIAPLTGSSSSFGAQVQSGIQVADGPDVEILYEDSRSDSKTALSAYRKLRDINRIDYLVSVGGETCEVLNKAVQRDRVVHIAVGCNTGVFDLPDSYSFRLDVNEAEAAEQTAQYLKRKGVTQVSLLNIENNWGGTVVKFMKSAFDDNGLTITDHITFPDSGAGNLRSEFAKLKRNKPGYIFMVAPPESVAVVLKQLSQLLIRVPIVSTISIENPDVPRLAGSNADGIIYLSVKKCELCATTHSDFFTTLGYGMTYASWGYDAVNLLRNAHRSTAPKQHLQSLEGFVGAFNVYNYDQSGELRLPYEMKRIEGGKFVFHEELQVMGG